MRVLQIEGAKDPDEFIVKFGEGRFKLAMENAISLVEFKVKNLRKDINLENAADKIKFLNEIAKILAKVENTIEREIYIEKIAKGYNISKEAIFAEVNKLIYSNSKGIQTLQEQNKTIRKVEQNKEEKISVNENLIKRENTIIALLIDANKNVFEKIKQNIKPEDFKDSINREIAQKLYEELEKQDSNINKLIDTFDEETQNHITMVMATDYEIENVEKAVDDILQKYKREKLDDRKQEILKQLETEQDTEIKQQLGKELNSIIIELAKIK